jgi:hypothetical protein
MPFQRLLPQVRRPVSQGQRQGKMLLPRFIYGQRNGHEISSFKFFKTADYAAIHFSADAASLIL